jgi:hypothetical protein
VIQLIGNISNTCEAILSLPIRLAGFGIRPATLIRRVGYHASKNNTAQHKLIHRSERDLYERLCKIDDEVKSC